MKEEDVLVLLERVVPQLEVLSRQIRKALLRRALRERDPLAARLDPEEEPAPDYHERLEKVWMDLNDVADDLMLSSGRVLFK